MRESGSFWFLARIGQSHVVRGGVAEGAGRGKAGLGWVSEGSDIEDSAVVCQCAGVQWCLPLSASLTGNCHQCHHLLWSRNFTVGIRSLES
ncbi:hypothetical protein E2C01_064034 [Portunus trituberculatus]|uniref:Uncharacterized protein n=1 Tax=Portunus trituberculatus TaxID=210409 RepID=A0A5B7HI12_PORTR|nr:hypothetical protein [Portunus trituberculatus]